MRIAWEVRATKGPQGPGGGAWMTFSRTRKPQSC